MSLLDGCTGWAAYWAALLPVLGPGVVATAAHRAHLFADTSKRRLFVAGPDLMAFSAARNARARLVPKNRRGRVATGAAFMEMRRINDIFRFGSERASAIIGTRARQAAGGSLPSARRSVSYPSAGRSRISGPSPGRPALSLPALAGFRHPAPRPRRAGLHSEENPAAAIQILCCV